MTEERNQLSEAAEELGRKLVWMVLCSSRKLRRATGLSPDQFREAMRELVREELVESAEFGALGRAVRMYWLTEKGPSRFGASEEQGSWHKPDAVGVMLQNDMPRVEAVYAVADHYATGGRTISAIHLVEREPMCGVAELSVPGESWPTYVVVCWASSLDTESELLYRLEAIRDGMRKRCLYMTDDFFPAALAIAGASEWCVARALTMACLVLGEWVAPSHITAWYQSEDKWLVSDGTSVMTGSLPEENPALLPPVSVLRPVPSVRKMGTKKFRRLIARLLWSGRAGQKLVQLLTLVGEHPVGAVGHYRALAGEAPEGKLTEKRMARLVELKLVKVVAKRARARAAKRLGKGVPVTLSEIGQGADRYILTKMGLNIYCYLHGGRPEDLPKRTKLGRLWTQVREKGTKRLLRIEDRWPYRHEDIVRETLAQFGEGRCPFAPGWQARTALADGKALEPDGKVLVGTPWGRRWCGLEVELSDTTYSALKLRCRKYASPHRRDDDPALFVLPDDRAERNLHRAAGEFDQRPKILTTTLRRLKNGGVFGTGVWSHYGTLVELTSPASGS